MDQQRPGARRGTRRAPRTASGSGLATLGLGLAGALALAAWVMLVVAAIRFGQSARGGEGTAWWFLAAACLGAVACLFLALVLGWRVLQTVRAARSAPAGVAGKRSARSRAR